MGATQTTPSPPSLKMVKPTKPSESRPVDWGTNLVDGVRIVYFPMLGRVDPLVQMFEYHGQNYEKVVIDHPTWAIVKDTEKAGEFSSLPILTLMNKGRQK